MKRPLALAIALAAALPANPGAAGEIADGIKRALAEKCINRDMTAVRVVEAQSGTVVYDHNGAEPLVPASVMKLLTTASALKYLGPAYRFKTKALYTGARNDGVIEGDLIIRGGGDPKLTPENLWIMARAIKMRGIKEVKGDLVADGSFFDGHSTAPVWSSRRTQRPYDAKICALSVNFNTIAVHVHPGEKAGDPLIVTLDPDSGYCDLINRGVTSARGGGVAAKRAGSGERARLVVSGSLKPGDGGEVMYVNIDKPLVFAAYAFRTSLERAGVKIGGKIRVGSAPADASALYTNESVPLPVILRELNRYSSNFVAEQIAKTIAAEIDGKPGAHDKALELTGGFMSELGVSMNGVTLADGSGLSRQNRLTARTLTDLLAAMSRRFDIGPDFMASLGIMGVDGSVKKRMEESPAKARARVKTGTLAQVSALAGYVQALDKKLYAFAIIQNDNRCYYKRADELEDMIVTAIYLDGGQ